MHLTFTTEAYGTEALKQVWVNYVRQIFAENKSLVGTGEVEYESLAALTDDEIAALKIYGTKKGEICKDCGLTTRYSVLQKAYEQELWYFPKPPEELMANVENYTEQEFDPTWLTPEAQGAQ